MRKIVLLLIILLATASPAIAVDFFNGFETNIDGWETPERVASGTDGISSSSGDYHAKATEDFTRWGVYSSEFPSNGYITRIDIYLNVDAGLPNDTRFDFTSAINNTGGTHRRDFAFNGGFYNDADSSPGSGSNRFVFSASNSAGRANASPKNPGREPIAVTETGWYTFQHKFYDNGSGVLAVDLSIIEKDGTMIHTWTLSDITDIIGDTVGGNRYGWFAANEFSYLAIDNTEKFDIILNPPAIPIPTLSEWGMIIFSLLLAGSAVWMIRRRQVS